MDGLAMAEAEAERERERQKRREMRAVQRRRPIGANAGRNLVDRANDGKSRGWVEVGPH